VKAKLAALCVILGVCNGIAQDSGAAINQQNVTTRKACEGFNRLNRAAHWLRQRGECFRIWQAIVENSREGSVSALREYHDRRGMIIYMGVFGKRLHRTVKMVFFIDKSKFSPDEIVGGLKDVKRWYYDYEDAKRFAEASLARLGGGGIKTVDSGDVEIVYNNEPHKLVTITLRVSGSEEPVDFSRENTWEELAFY